MFSSRPEIRKCLFFYNHFRVPAGPIFGRVDQNFKYRSLENPFSAESGNLLNGPRYLAAALALGHLSVAFRNPYREPSRELSGTFSEPFGNSSEPHGAFRDFRNPPMIFWSPSKYFFGAFQIRSTDLPMDCSAWDVAACVFLVGVNG